MARTNPGTGPLLEYVLDVLGGEICSGEMPVGSVFTLGDLSERFGISRTVAREVMRALEQLGLVASSRRVGLTVQPMAQWSVLDQAVIRWRLNSRQTREDQLRSLALLRTAIEPVAAREAARHATEAQRAELLEMADRLGRIGAAGRANTDDFLEVDVAFHSLILEASANEMIVALTESVVSVMRGRTEFGLQPARLSDKSVHHHLDLARAIADGDAGHAAELSRALLVEVDAQAY
ncbi:transcriptional regulator [Corynebacterium frankenforstense DSM 45800]|uniref:Transcriptional regulator n=1 Tax=Corynebacterium frankenforstense DSM 45800 TaxID=1437875 RepID=A0A1L7CUG9_9CORY|nr:FCD domain-containing protein [Corynebacterium frankenforstense]APT89472.1 transcriptional regulator [Corynebacterium frankenforstense DSM 45800]